MLKTLFSFLKKQIIFVISLFLAIFSTIIFRPQAAEILSAIDFRSLSILFCLMAVVQCFSINVAFSFISIKIISSIKKTWNLIFALVSICFFFSMFITNDVALITFVPLTISILTTAGLSNLICITIVLETLAANLGSMLTPVGNPQNLYLFNLMGLDVFSFMKIMLPYSVLSFLLLVLCILIGKFFAGRKMAGGGKFPGGGKMSTGKKNPPACERPSGAASERIVVSKSSARFSKSQISFSKIKIIIFSLLAIISLATVFNLIPYFISLPIVFVTVLFTEKKALGKVDYILLLTFIGFFIFTGNLSHSPKISSFISSILQNREILCGIFSSQVISNVPAALLLSTFTKNLRDLTIGVNLGGLGTLIASMASLISFKFYGGVEGAKTGKYLAVFTGLNVLFLLILYPVTFFCR